LPLASVVAEPPKSPPTNTPATGAPVAAFFTVPNTAPVVVESLPKSTTRCAPQNTVTVLVAVMKPCFDAVNDVWKGVLSYPRSSGARVKCPPASVYALRPSPDTSAFSKGSCVTAFTTMPLTDAASHFCTSEMSTFVEEPSVNVAETLLSQ